LQEIQNRKSQEATMIDNRYVHFADALVFVHGPRASHEAARHAELCLKQGDTDMAAHWRATLDAVKTLKNPVPCNVPASLCA
jgi:hypothetical protein